MAADKDHPCVVSTALNYQSNGNWWRGIGRWGRSPGILRAQADNIRVGLPIPLTGPFVNEAQLFSAVLNSPSRN